MTRQYTLVSGANLRVIFLIALATVQLASFAVDAQGSSTRWPTTEFKVVHHEPIVAPYPQAGAPIDAVLAGIRETLRKAVLGQEKIMERQKYVADAERLVESYLHDIAMRYQEAGFEPPELQRVNHDGKEKYVVYLYNFSDSIWSSEFFEPEPLGIAYNSFHLGQNWIAINREKHIYIKMTIAERVFLYSTLAHEVFHAIQGTYDRKFGSIRPVETRVTKPRAGENVIIEGVAQGAAMYLVSKRFPSHLETIESTQFNLGGFLYYTMFLNAQRKGSPNAYHTGSFWFHLAERFGSLSVIEYLLRRRLPILPTMANRIRWLEEGLKNHPGIKEGL